MITREELNPHNYSLTSIQQANFDKLYEAMNAFRAVYGKPMIVNSGVRSEFDQQRINPKAPGSAHVRAAACDISDADNGVWGFCMANMELLERLGLYLEDKRSTPRWVHFQVCPPKSGHRVFIP